MRIGMALGLALLVAAGACSRSDEASGAASGGRTGAAARSGRPGSPKPPADPMAGAKTYPCEGDEELHVAFKSDRSGATVRLGDGVAAYLPREEKVGVEAYSDGARTLGVSRSGDMAYTEAPAPPTLCHANRVDPKDPKVEEKAPGKAEVKPPVAREAAGKVSDTLPAPKAADVTRNLTVADKGKTVDMRVGEKVSVTLEGIPTAGYVWMAEVTPRVVRVTDGPSGPTRVAQTQPGYAGGNHWEVLVVEGVAAGEGELVLAMRRPWEKPAPDDERFSVKVRVK